MWLRRSSVHKRQNTQGTSSPEDVLNHKQKKVQAVLALNPPNSVKELQQFFGMVRYYRDMRAKRSEMLAPLTDLVGECGETKATKKNGLKRNHGDGSQSINKRLTM